VRLSADEPIGSVLVAMDQGDDAVEVDVVSIDNPSLQGVHIDVAVVGVFDGQNATEVVGTLTPFPPDQPSAYLLRLSDRASALVAGAEGSASVELRLRPVDGTVPLEPDIELVVGVELIPAESLGGMP
jgi:hypothetical protein